MTMSAFLALFLVVEFSLAGDGLLALLWVLMAALEILHLLPDSRPRETDWVQAALWRGAVFVIHLCYGLQFHA